jgi:hypothetical protein
MRIFQNYDLLDWIHKLYNYTIYVLTTIIIRTVVAYSLLNLYPNQVKQPSHPVRSSSSKSPSLTTNCFLAIYTV